MTQKISLSAVLMERAAVIMRLKAHELPLDWVKEFSVRQLMACCDRMDAVLPDRIILERPLQRELIQNPNFAAWLAKLLPMFPAEPPVEEKKPEPAYTSSRYRAASPVLPPSRRAVLMGELCQLMEACTVNAKDVTAYPQDKVMDVLELDRLTGYMRLVFLENFADGGTSCQTAAAGIRNCSVVPLELDEQQRKLLLEPFVADRYMFSASPFDKISALLDACPELLDIVRLLHDKQVRDELTLKYYEVFAQDAAAYHQLLAALTERLESDAVSKFIQHWQRSGCPIYELRTMERRTREMPETDWTTLLSTYSGYINQLYGSRFKQIDLANVKSYQEDILIYAIVHNKKHFIRLVDEHAEAFLRLPYTSVLFQEKLYREHFNLNELSEKDLADCFQMEKFKLDAECLAPGRRYTFQELRELYGVSENYRKLYHGLESGSQDYRLKVFRQVCRREVLPPGMDDAGIAALAAHLDSKPLDIWMQKEFAHISGLKAKDAARMLAHLDKLEQVLPSIQDRTDALLVLRSLDVIGQYGSVAALKDSLLETDTAWLSLSERMKLTPEFRQQHRETIVRFLCRNGADISEKYCWNLDYAQREAFLRVVKAELMGQLDRLKYYEGDLQRELDSQLTDRIKTGWKVNLQMSRDGLEVQERDDFFSTMLLGTQPQRTCLAYADGVYKNCLLSAFDSNKKILYAVLDGRIVGRAFLRLTKGRLTEEDKSVESGFTFVDLEHTEASRPEPPKERENLTLFLERPYISGVGPEAKRNIKQLFIELAGRKADELDTMLALSRDYKDEDVTGFAWTKYAVYISKSKAGAQYLDSLDGEASVSSEGSYKSNTFLVRKNGLRLSTLPKDTKSGYRPQRRSA